MRTILMCSVVAAFFSILLQDATAADRDKALAIIQDAIKAQGGEKALTRTHLSVRNASGTLFLAEKEQPFTSEVAVQLPSRLRMTINLGKADPRTQLLLVINDDKGWQSAGGAVTEIGKERLAELQEEAYFLWVRSLVPLVTDESFELTLLAPADAGEPVIGVSVTRKEHGDVKLYFDKKTHLLARVNGSVREAGTQVEKELTLSEYQEFDGVKLPTKLMETQNGKKVSELTVTGYRFLQKAEEGMFAKP